MEKIIVSFADKKTGGTKKEELEINTSQARLEIILVPSKLVREINSVYKKFVVWSN